MKLAWVALFALASPASADPALLLGFDTGASLALPSQRARFIMGAGPELLTDDGWLLGLRGELSHALDGDASLTLGWAGAGIVQGEGLPFGLGVGPLAAWTRSGEALVGGHARLLWGLWYARAILELGTSLAAGATGTTFSVTLGLRWVPWPAIAL